MMPVRRLLLGVAGGLAVLAVVESVAPVARPAGTAASPAPIVAGRPDAAPVDPRRLIAIIVARPLLRPDRRPVAAAGTHRTRRHLPRLSGILIGDGVKLAMFADAAGGTTMRAEGSTIGRYRVVRITAGAVMLSAGGVTMRLVPRFAKLDGTAPPPVAALKLETPRRE